MVDYSSNNLYISRCGDLMQPALYLQLHMFQSPDIRVTVHPSSTQVSLSSHCLTIAELILRSAKPRYLSCGYRGFSRFFMMLVELSLKNSFLHAAQILTSRLLLKLIFYVRFGLVKFKNVIENYLCIQDIDYIQEKTIKIQSLFL